MQRNSELDDSKKIGYELIKKINDYKTGHGSYPLSISQFYSELEDNKGIEKNNIHYFYSPEDTFEIFFTNSNWAWFKLKYWKEQNEFDLSDSD